MRRAFLIAIAVLFCACSTPTQLLVEVRPAPGLPPLTALVVDVLEAESGERTQGPASLAIDGSDWFRSFAVVPRGGDATRRARVVLTGCASRPADGDTCPITDVVASQQLRATFVAGRKIRVPIEISLACSSVECSYDRVCVAAGAATSCEPIDGRTSIDAGPPPPSLDTFGVDLAAAKCELISRCVGGDSTRNLLLALTSDEECVSEFSQYYAELALPRYRAAIAAGTLTFDASSVGACLQAVELLGCAGLYSGLPLDCRRALTGQVSLGGSCHIDAECGDGYCNVDSACPGTCEVQLAVDAACTRSEQCAAGLVCVGGLCAAAPNGGEICGGSSGVDCAVGFVCVGGSGTASGTCDAIRDVFSAALHEPCSLASTQYCAAGLACVATSAAAQTCEPADLASGLPCHPAVPESCASGLYCAGADFLAGDFEGICTALPAAGMACTHPLVPGASCGAGLRCDQGTCRETHVAGQSCVSNADCWSGNCASPTCAPPLPCP